MKLFVGLGNPGSGYARHRHNVGFMALERIAERHGLGPWKKRYHGLVTEGPIGGRRVMLLMPQTYMNDSGQAVGEAQRYLKIDEGDIYVFHDEIDLAPGQAQGEGRRRQRRPQRPALDLGACGQRVRAGAHRRRPSGLQGPGQRLRAARLRQGRPGLAGAACSMQSPTRRDASPPATRRAS